MKKGKKNSIRSREKSRSKSKSRKTPLRKPSLTMPIDPPRSFINSAAGFYSTPAQQAPQPERDYRKEYESLAVVLDDYEKMLDDRLKNLRGKWGQVKVLEKSLAETVHTSKDENLLQVENNFYINKITELQKCLNQKEAQLKQLREWKAKVSSVGGSDGQEESWLRETNSLLERENRVLKQKLKEAGIL